TRSPRSTSLASPPRSITSPPRAARSSSFSKARPCPRSRRSKRAPMVKEFFVETPGKGLHEITDKVVAAVHAARVNEGLCTIFVRHTSASLVLQENADPSAKRDLERWHDRLVPEGDPFYRHDAEGPDDMTAHIKAAL